MFYNDFTSADYEKMYGQCISNSHNDNCLSPQPLPIKAPHIFLLHLLFLSTGSNKVVNKNLQKKNILQNLYKYCKINEKWESRYEKHMVLLCLFSQLWCRTWYLKPLQKNHQNTKAIYCVQILTITINSIQFNSLKQCLSPNNPEEILVLQRK